ncbi:GIY-YIG nuclease family protein [Microbacterium sp. NPDC089695]|uniref:GIY-YIG nuclease family protein n=1 Tax=Microbacterium sp. NPDC089695 TaxID=3364198 RepID=UPI00380EE2E1
MTALSLPDPCPLCGRSDAVRVSDGLECAWCEWPFGAVPEADIPRAVVEVVYYLRFDRRVKIGTSRRPRQRLASIRHEELLAFEAGGRDVEQARHRQFATIREGGEWFTLDAALEAHVATLRTTDDPWQLYARWVSAALRP